MRSAIYTGDIWHQRHTPRRHGFSYRAFMMLTYLDELPELVRLSPLWGLGRWAPARFRRADFFGDSDVPLEEAVRDHIEKQSGTRPDGPIALLANWRYFGFNMNPISVYYCFDAKGEQVRWLLLDVHNTPWGERHGYVLSVNASEGPLEASFDKDMHVSPFMPMNQRYHWCGSVPGDEVSINLSNLEAQHCVFEAGLKMQRQPVSARSLNALMIRFPLMTVKVCSAIYWQALKLYLKRVPLHRHPGQNVPLESGVSD